MLTLSKETQASAAKLSATLERYISLRRIAVAEILAKKGRDLGIQLYRQYAEHKFGGPGKKKRGLAMQQFKDRLKQGRGIKIREELKRSYGWNKKWLTKQIRSSGQLSRWANSNGTLDQWSNAKEQAKKLRETRRTLWQNIVKSEISTRQSGIGALAASFLWYRYRKKGSTATERRIVRNRTGHPAGEIDTTKEGVVAIRGYTEGLAKIDVKYGIVSKAMNAVSADMAQYIARKEAEAQTKAKR